MAGQKKKTWTTSYNPDTGEVSPTQHNYPDNFPELYAKLVSLEITLDKVIDEKEQYKKAYNLMCDETWDLIPDEEKDVLHKKLKELKV